MLNKPYDTTNPRFSNVKCSIRFRYVTRENLKYVGCLSLLVLLSLAAILAILFGARIDGRGVPGQRLPECK